MMITNLINHLLKARADYGECEVFRASYNNESEEIKEVEVTKKIVYAQDGTHEEISIRL